MKFSAATVLATAAIAAAAPAQDTELSKRAVNDAQILNYALTLEHLENAFYSEALSKFSYADFKSSGHPFKWFYRNLQEVAYDESTHVSFISGALKAAGYQAVLPCKYSFGLTDVNTFLATAAILEGVGVTAYLGAANLISNPDYLTAAGSILTIESRHSAIIRAHNGLAPFGAPFDVPQDFNQVYSLASLFITSCPKANSKAMLPMLMAFPALTPGPTSAVAPGMALFVTSAKKLTGDVYYSWASYSGSGMTGKATTMDGKKFKVKVPMTGVNGQSFVTLTSSDAPASDDNTLAGPAIVEVKSAENGLN